MKRIPGTNKRTQILLGFLLVWMGCSSPRDIIIISGQTMGTTYSIKIIHVGLFEAQKKIEQGIDSILTEVNRKMSTWDPNSEISLFGSQVDIFRFTSVRIESMPCSIFFCASNNPTWMILIE